MGRIEELISKIEVADTATSTQFVVEPNIRKYYQKNGIWYAVVSIWVKGCETKMHIALQA